MRLFAAFFRAAMTFMLCAIAAQTAAQSGYPSKPIKYIVVFAPGGTTDILARLIAPRLAEALGQPVVVENRPGAGGSVGSELLAKSAPDGYTIGGGTISSHAINVSLYSKLAYDPVKDFAPVTLLATTPMLLAVGAGTPYKSLQDLIAAAKASPGKLSYASGGNGTPPHLAAAIFTEKTGTQMVHVPYKGSGPALIDVMAGQVTMIIDTAASATPHVRSGKMRGIAITGKRRWPDLPEVPTFAEGGLTDYDASSWYAIHAPAGTPKPVIAKLNAELVRIVNLPDIRERLRQMSAEPVGNTPEQFDAFVKSEIAKWGTVIKALNLRVD